MDEAVAPKWHEIRLGVAPTGEHGGPLPGSPQIEDVDARETVDMPAPGDTRAGASPSHGRPDDRAR